MFDGCEWIRALDSLPPYVWLRLKTRRKPSHSDTKKHFFREIRVWRFECFMVCTAKREKITAKDASFPSASFSSRQWRALVLVAYTATPTIGWTWEAKLENCFSYTPADGSRVCVACNGIQSSSERIFPTTFGCVYWWEGREAGKKQKNSTHDKWRLAFDSSSSSSEKNIDSWRLFMITGRSATGKLFRTGLESN